MLGCIVPILEILMDSHEQLHSRDDRHLVPDGTHVCFPFPSGRHTKNYGKTPCYEWENSRNFYGDFPYVSHYQRVYIYIHVPYRCTYHQWVLHKIPPAPRFDTSPEDHWAKSLDPAGFKPPVVRFLRYIPGWWWLEPWNFMTFHILGIIIPTDELIFFRGVEATNQ